MNGGAGGDVEDPASVPVPHVRQIGLGELERRAYLHFEHESVVRLAEGGSRFEIGDRSIVHEDVDRPGRGDDPGAVVSVAEIGRHGFG